MQFSSPQTPSKLIRAQFLRREKRFFVYAIREDTGEQITAHCPNTGSLKGVLTPDFNSGTIKAIYLSDHGPNTKRSLRFTHELTEKELNGQTVLIGSHTGRANQLAVEALEAGLIPAFHNWICKTEVKFADRQITEKGILTGTRFDLHLTCPHTNTICWGEVKNTTLAIPQSGDNCTAAFPDSVTERGTKHLTHLTDWVKNGGQALQIYIVQREDTETFSPAALIDPTYAAALWHFQQAGGHIAAVACRFPRDEHGIPTAIIPNKLLKLDIPRPIP